MHEDGTSPASPVPSIQGRQGHVEPQRKQIHRSANLRAASSSGTATTGTGSTEGKGGSALAPCFDGGISANGNSVGQILARSLGNAAAAVRRNRSRGGEGTDRSIANKRGGAHVGDSSQGRKQDPDRYAIRSRWRSWNETPPEALLTAEEIRRVSGEGQQDDRRRQRPPPEVVAEVVPPLQNRRRSKNGTGSSADPDGKNDLSISSTPGVSGTGTAAAAAAAAKRTPGRDARSRGSKEGAPVSTASSASSRRSSAGGVSLVPRVAMLAAAAPTADKTHAGAAARKGKDFDPDQLECVRRHEASVAEKERRVRTLRTEEEKRTQFRARPLPGFLESGGGGSGGGGAVGQQSRRDRQGAVLSATVVPGTSPELLAALEQVPSESNDRQ